MEPNRVPPALRERLGDRAALELLDLLETSGRTWGDQAVNIAVDRFERRLTEEMSSLRVEIAQIEARLEKKLYEGLAGVRQELATNRAELLKWSFVFWIGQVMAVAGLLAFMLRTVGR